MPKKQNQQQQDQQQQNQNYQQEFANETDAQEVQQQNQKSKQKNQQNNQQKQPTAIRLKTGASITDGSRFLMFMRGDRPCIIGKYKSTGNEEM